MNDPIIELQGLVVHKMIVRMLMSYVAPVVFGLAPGGEKDGQQTQNASAAVLEIGSRRFIITADHVLKGFEKLGDHARARFQIGNAEPFEPHIVDRDADLDLVVIDGAHLCPGEIAEAGANIPFWPIHPAQWPPARLSVGDIVCFGGWPQRYRTSEEGDRILTTASWSLSAAEVSDVTDEGFVCVFDRSRWHDDVGAIEGGADATDLGGLSGCPAFALRGLSFEYVGVLFEFVPSWETMRFRSTRLIGSDGKLLRRH